MQIINSKNTIKKQNKTEVMKSAEYEAGLAIVNTTRIWMALAHIMSS